MIIFCRTKRFARQGSTDQMFGYVKLRIDNDKIGFLVFHYGAETNLRKLPCSRTFLLLVKKRLCFLWSCEHWPKASSPWYSKCVTNLVVACSVWSSGSTKCWVKYLPVIFEWFTSPFFISGAKVSYGECRSVHFAIFDPKGHAPWCVMYARRVNELQRSYLQLGLIIARNVGRAIACNISS